MSLRTDIERLQDLMSRGSFPADMVPTELLAILVNNPPEPQFMPSVAPLGIDVSPEMVQEVWDTFVKPDQDKGLPQSGEMRVLMAILRAAYVALGGK